MVAFEVAAADWVGRLHDADLARAVDSGTFTRGLEYADAGRVVSLATADRGRVLVAEVTGNGRSPYQTLVSRLSDAAVPTWVGRCSCPVGSDCKHSIAVLITARRSLGPALGAPYALSPEDESRLGIASEHGRPGVAGDAGRLFTGQGQWRGEEVRTVPAWARVLEPMMSSDDLGGVPRTALALMVTPVEHGSRVPGERVFGLSLRPTRMSRAGTWTGSWGWDQALGPLSARSMEPDHVALGLELCRLDQAQAAYAYNHRPQTIDLGHLGPDFWPWLDRATEAGIALVAGTATRPTGGRRTLAARGARGAAAKVPALTSVVVAPEPVVPELDVVRRGAGLVLRANLAGVPGTVGAESAADLVAGGRRRAPTVVVHPLGSPVHGVAVLSAGVLTLAPVVPVLPTGFDAMFAGDEVVVPDDDVERFLAFYYPRLRRRLRVVSPDASVDLPDPEPVRVHLRVVPHSVGDLEVVASFAYPGAGGPTLVPVAATDRWRDRDVSAERELLARLDVLDVVPGLRWAERTGGHRLVPSVHVRGLAAASFVEDVLPRWEAHEDLIVVRDGELAAYEQATEAPLIEWSPTPDNGGNDWLDLHVSVTVGGETVPFEPLFQGLVRGDDVMLLDSGTWFPLDDPTLDRLRELIQEARQLGDPTSDGVRVSRFQVDLFAELLELGVIDRENREWADRLVAIRDGIVLAEASLPMGVKAELRPYQREGFQWLATLWDAGLGGVLADDMGLGKTLQTLAVVQRAHDRGDLDAPVLVVAPTSVLSTWQDEAHRFTPGLSVAVVGETTRRRRTPLAEVIGSAHVVVTSYAVFRIDAESFRGHRWRALVLDEAQALKNSSSQTYQAARRLVAPFKLVVTGTPLENSLMDLWALLSVAAPGLYPRRDHFSQHYRKPIETGNAPELLERLRRRIRPLMLRRTKEEVAADLPPKQVQVLPVPLHPVHQRIYDQHLQRERQRLLGLLDDAEANRIAILASLTRLRQLSLDPSLVDAAHAGKAVSAKVTELAGHLAELRQEGHRALVFSQFTGYLRLVEQALAEEGISTTYLDGRTRNRPAVIERFRTGDATAFLISLKAGGVGLTLTEADYVFVLDPWWNPATEAQAIDRAHRIGQTRPVMVYRMVSTGTVEDKVVALQERKRDLFARVVDGGDPLGGIITSEDIRALIEA